MAKLSAQGVRKAINKLLSQATKQIKVLKKRKKTAALRKLGSVLYEIRDTIEDGVGMFEELSADAEQDADELEDANDDDE